MPLANTYLAEGENGFTGMMSRMNPLELEPGFVHYAQNMRFDQGTASTRKGVKRLTTSTNVASTVYDSGVYSDPTTGIEKVVLVCGTCIYVYNTSDDTVSAAINFPAGRTVSSSDKVCCFQASNRFYIMRGQSAAAVSASNVQRTAFTVSAQVPSGSFIVGDEITVSGADQAGYNGTFLVIATSSGIGYQEINYTITSAPATPATGAITVARAKPALYWDGASTISVVPQTVISGSAANFPPSDFGIYFQNRIIVKQSRDKIAASDYFDFDTWDLAFNQFTINLGANDSIVGFQPWQEDKFLIFERNSIYYAYVDPNGYASGAAPGAESYIKSLTSEFGCSARRSLVNAGEYIFFLSDNGVYLLNPSLDLKLLGNTKPLSDPISDIIRRINASAVQNAVGRVFNNRYYLAVPLDSSTRNNAVLVYSMLNQAWESVDTYPTNMYVDNLLVAIYGNSRRLYTTNKEGGLGLMEELNYDEFISTGGGIPLPFVLPATLTASFNSFPIPGQIVTRRYFYDTFSAKRFSSAEIDLTMVGSDAVNIVARAVNPDNESTVFTFTSSVAEDYTKRFRIGKRGFGLDLEINTTQGRPTIGGLRVYANIPGRTVVSAE